MPNTGDRDDIGPITNPNAQWLISQDRAAAARCSGAGECGGQHSMAFLLAEARTTTSRSMTIRRLWGDPRGTPTLTQPMNDQSWGIDTAHQPNLSFVPYLLTGERFHLDQLTARHLRLYSGRGTRCARTAKELS